MFAQDSSRKLLLQRHKRPNIVSSHTLLPPPIFISHVGVEWDDLSSFFLLSSWLHAYQFAHNAMREERSGGQGTSHHWNPRGVTAQRKEGRGRHIIICFVPTREPRSRNGKCQLKTLCALECLVKGTGETLQVLSGDPDVLFDVLFFPRPLG